MTPIAHGGRLAEAMRRYPDAPTPWIDLSTGISPHAYPFTVPGPDAWRRLPEPEAVAALEAVAARAYGVSDPACVVAAPGTQALIQLMPRLFPQRRIAIPGPTYAEHEAAWRAAGTVIDPVATCLVLCNPNNPDGRRHDPAALAAHSHDLLIVDEAYADFEPGLSLAPYLPLPKTIVLRSFGKAYGLAGLRLGFALTTPANAAMIRTALGPWPISGPAVAIGTESFADATWRAEAAVQAHAASARLDILLHAAGLTHIGGTALFRTVQTAAAHPLADHLARAGLLVRRFAHAGTWLRMGLPPDESAWARLSAVLARPRRLAGP